jgi:hypothetical protein
VKKLSDLVELRLIKAHTSADGAKTAKVYKDLEWGEYRVKHFTDGNHHQDADYHTSGTDKEDLEDAHNTARAWLGEEAEVPDSETSVGYRPNPDPKMVKEKPGAEARFVAKHMTQRKTPRFTDIDKSTLDDALFSATNIKRSVPQGPDNRHGHVPTGADAKVYEGMKGDIIAEALDKKAKKPVQKAGGEDQEAQIEAYHEKTLARHEDALKRSRAEAYHVGWQQDFGADKSCITSKTNKGLLTTEHVHGVGSFKHTWAEDGAKK